MRTFLYSLLLLLAMPFPTLTHGQKVVSSSEVPQTGLFLWLTGESAAQSLSEDQTSGPLETWPDLSSNERHLTQLAEDFQPTVTRLDGGSIVQFDGNDDFFRFVAKTKPSASAEALTVFVVAAPTSNPGDFRGFLASNAPDGRDYETGFNIDLGPGPSFEFDNLNVEGKGFGGAQNLMSEARPFGQLCQIELSVDPDSRTVQVHLDGEAGGSRPWTPNPISLAELTVGGRYYTNGPGSQQPRSPFAGAIAEILIYDRSLSSDETTKIRSYLEEKYQTLGQQLPEILAGQREGIVLQKHPNPADVQMMLPGFEVDYLPVQLTNVNNVRYRSDGTLVTLGYNGDIHLLRDTDGDGLEDSARLFWKNKGSLRGPIGMALTPPNYPKGSGVFVPSKGKVSLIVDTDGDDQADEEIIVATGWPEIFPNVDAVGICLDDENNIYFGLGVADFSNAYQVDESGIAKYNRQGENGTIQKVSADFTKRETICTGIRFPIGMGINQYGDLFCTEQEGATWLPNGNPRDELLWIRPERHYGFPPRHPKYNPDVIDEPSVEEFGPQHQSTCGMVFNVPVNGGPVFGKTNWEHDALICGESRGKIWRTSLYKTEHGYLANKQLLACLQMLTIDCCVAPDGSLVVACHSGPPDWGTGPLGAGKLFRIRPAQQNPPRPVDAWQQSEREIRIAFDGPLNPLQFQQITDQVQIQYGKYVEPGDDFENLVPPYAAVHRQLQTPRFASQVRSIGLTADRRTVLIATDPIRTSGGISIVIPTSEVAIERPTQLQQAAVMEAKVRNTGALVQWTADSEPLGEAITVPHWNLKASQTWTADSALHRTWFESSATADTLLLHTQLDIHDVLRPAIQPGDSIDYQWPEEIVTLEVRSSQPFSLTVDGKGLAAIGTREGYQVQWTAPPNHKDWLDINLELRVGDAVPDVQIAWFTNEDSRRREIPGERFHLPWIVPGEPEAIIARQELPAELEGGHWGRGRQVFHSQAANCFKCHRLDESGGLIGPSLSNLRHRDFASVQRDILHPSFSINPDYSGQTILLEDGRTLTGILRTVDGTPRLGDHEGNWLAVDPTKIEESQPAAKSIMPEGLLDKLTDQQRKDLFVYLLTPPPSMPLDSPLQAPPLRSQQEVADLLKGAEEVAPQLIRLVLVAGPKDHGPGEHDYPAWQKQWGQLLLADSATEVELAWEFPTEEQIDKADVLVFFQKGNWDDHRQKLLDPFFQRGGGAVYLHWAVNGERRSADKARRIGLSSRAGAVGFRHGPLTLDLHNTDHPIMRNFGARLELYDESYWGLTGDPGTIHLLASSNEEGASRPQIWTYEPGKGRVFVGIPGHYNWTFDDPLFRVLLLRGIAWSAGQSVDRYNDLVPLGARISR